MAESPGPSIRDLVFCCDGSEGFYYAIASTLKVMLEGDSTLIHRPEEDYGRPCIQVGELWLDIGRIMLRSRQRLWPERSDGIDPLTGEAFATSQVHPTKVIQFFTDHHTYCHPPPQEVTEMLTPPREEEKKPAPKRRSAPVQRLAEDGTPLPAAPPRNRSRAKPKPPPETLSDQEVVLAQGQVEAVIQKPPPRKRKAPEPRYAEDGTLIPPRKRSRAKPKLAQSAASEPATSVLLDLVR